ncbi:MAG TPA: hypothetical protein VGJ41_12590 [Nocardioides sp.]
MSALATVPPRQRAALAPPVLGGDERGRDGRGSQLFTRDGEEPDGGRPRRAPPRTARGRTAHRHRDGEGGSPMREQELIDMFQEADRAPEPLLRRIDLTSLIETGHRRVRRRRALVSAAVAAAVAVVTVGVVTVTGAANQDRASIEPATGQTAPAQRWSGSLTQRFTVGWAPPELSTRSVDYWSAASCGVGTRGRCESGVQMFSAQRPNVERPDDDAVPSSVTVQVYGRGDYPQDRRHAVATPADSIAGHRTFVGHAEASESCLALRWEYQPNAWAEVECSRSGDEKTPAGHPQPGDAALLRRIAESVRIENRPIRLPFRISELLASLGVVSMKTMHDPKAHGISADLFLSSTPDGTVKTPTWSGTSGLLVTVYSATNPGPFIGHDGKLVPAGRAQHDPPNAKVDGHDAIWTGDPRDPSELQVIRDGVVIALRVDKREAKIIGGRNGLLRVYRSVKLVDDPGNPATWVDRPLG